MRKIGSAWPDSDETSETSAQPFELSLKQELAELRLAINKDIRDHIHGLLVELKDHWAHGPRPPSSAHQRQANGGSPAPAIQNRQPYQDNPNDSQWAQPRQRLDQNAVVPVLKLPGEPELRASDISKEMDGDLWKDPNPRSNGHSKESCMRASETSKDFDPHSSEISKESTVLSDDVDFERYRPSKMGHPAVPTSLDSGVNVLLESVDVVKYKRRTSLQGRMLTHNRARNLILRRCCYGHWILQVFDYINRSVGFNTLIGVVIFLNAVSIGARSDYVARNPHEEDTVALLVFVIIEYIFLLIFSLELSIRLLANGLQFFVMPGWRWNVFDIVIVGAQLVEESLEMLRIYQNGLPSVSFMRVLRVLRVMRIIRLVRFVRFISELRILTTSLLTSLRSLFWTILLLSLIIYCVAVFFMQMVSDFVMSSTDEEANRALRHHFGDLLTSVLTLFKSVTGGVDWGDVATPLMEHMSIWLGAVYAIYQAFVLMAMMNVFTGVFVECVMRCNRGEKDRVVVELMNTVFGDRGGEGRQLSWSEFQDHMRNQRVKRLLNDIDLDVSEASRLFKLLDRDHSGTIDQQEFMQGCLRLKGPAKALDLAVLMDEMIHNRKAIAEMHNGAGEPLSPGCPRARSPAPDQDRTTNGIAFTKARSFLR